MQIRSFLIFFFLSVTVGCAPSAKLKKQETVFFPPAPDPPRVQFLLGIADSRDVIGSEVETSLFSLDSTQGEKVKRFVKPYGVSAFGHKIYVSDTLGSQVAVIDLVEKSFEWLKGNFGPGKMLKPTALVNDAEGSLYVADSVRKKVLVYDVDGNFVREYGEGYNLLPVSVAVDKRRVYVLDRKYRKLLVFNKTSGELIESFGQDSEDPNGKLYLPTNMTLTPKGIFYIADAGVGRIVSIDRDGHLLKAFGKLGDGFGQFARPKGIASDDKGRLFVVDTAHQNIQVFNPEQKLLIFFGNPGQAQGSLNVPAGLAVSKDNLEYFQKLAAPGFKLEEVVLAINQVGEHRIVIYGFGQQEGFDYDAYYKQTLKLRESENEEQ